MVIEFTKHADGRTVLRCVRADGSVTWQRNDNRNALFFPLHDLTHYAVETELGYAQGFFGLVADGWEIDETTGKTARGALPNEALEVEYIVSAFSAESAGGVAASATEFNQLAATFANAKRMPRPRQLSEEDLVKVRARMSELFTAWSGVLPGETLRLEFPPR
jgi:hypothetical protein